MTVPRRRPPRRRQPLMRFERGRVCSWRKALAWLGLGTPQSEETEVAEDHVSCGLWDPWAQEQVQQLLLVLEQDGLLPRVSLH